MPDHSRAPHPAPSSPVPPSNGGTNQAHNSKNRPKISTGSAIKTPSEIIGKDAIKQLASEGYAVVRREPTNAMMNAGLYQSSHDAEWADVYSMWVDMVDSSTLETS